MTSEPIREHNEETAASGEMLEAARREKLKRLQELGVDPWGGRLDGHLSIAAILARQGEIVAQPAGEAEAGKPPELHGPTVRAAGRVVLKRIQGKKMQFLHVQDWSGRIQVLLSKGLVGDENWAVIECLDLGDLVGIDGEFKRTKTGEPTIFATHVHFLTKSIETPPAKHKGLLDAELRQRMRYIDLAYNEGVLERFLRRTKIVQSIRNTLGGEGFVEVEGPTLHSIAGGAAARPFITHHNALDMQLFLRIALELHLKRLLVGGVERVYELGRVYRNEGIDARHNPEFTMLELYQAYGDYRSMMDLTEKIIAQAIQATGQDLRLSWGDVSLDFTPPFQRKTYDELFEQYTGVSAEDTAGIAVYAKRLGMETTSRHPDVIKSEVFEHEVEDQLSGPIFVIDYPASICPLTKRKKGKPEIAERFELYVAGMEVANAYTELNDPDLQEKLFTQQLDGLPEEESMARMDHDFIRALRHGMPPAGGLGIGIDRLVMLLTNSQTIRDVILFPLLRPEAVAREAGTTNEAAMTHDASKMTKEVGMTNDEKQVSKE